MCVYACVSNPRVPLEKPHPSQPRPWNMKEGGREGGRVLPAEWKHTTRNRVGAFFSFFLFFFSFLWVIILLYLFARQTSCSLSSHTSSILHIGLASPPAASLSERSGCEPCSGVQAARSSAQCTPRFRATGAVPLLVPRWILHDVLQRKGGFA